MKASENPFPGILIRESANDGSDFSNPATDYRVAFLGEDGLWHVKDSAGTVTDPFSGSGAVATDAIWDAAGDLAVGSGANTAAKLTMGTANGMILQRASGAVAWGYPPFRGAKVYNSATQTMNGSGTNSGNTIITFDSEEFDTDTLHDTGSNTSRITPHISGYWKVGFMVYGSNPQAGALVDVLVAGANTSKHGMRCMAKAAANGTWNAEFIVNLTATTDYLELQMNNPNASSFAIGHASATVVQTTFWAYFLGV